MAAIDPTLTSGLRSPLRITFTAALQGPCGLEAISSCGVVSGIFDTDQRSLQSGDGQWIATSSGPFAASAREGMQVVWTGTR